MGLVGLRIFGGLLADEHAGEAPAFIIAALDADTLFGDMEINISSVRACGVFEQGSAFYKDIAYR